MGLGYILGCLEIFWVLLWISSKSGVSYYMYDLIWIFIPCMLGKHCWTKCDREFPALAWSFMANLSWNIRIWLPIDTLSYSRQLESLDTPPWKHKNLQNNLVNCIVICNIGVQMSIRMDIREVHNSEQWVILGVCQVTDCGWMTCLSLLLFATKFNTPLGPIPAGDRAVTAWSCSFTFYHQDIMYGQEHLDLGVKKWPLNGHFTNFGNNTSVAHMISNMWAPRAGLDAFVKSKIS